MSDLIVKYNDLVPLRPGDSARIIASEEQLVRMNLCEDFEYGKIIEITSYPFIKTLKIYYPGNYFYYNFSGGHMSNWIIRIDMVEKYHGELSSKI